MTDDIEVPDNDMQNNIVAAGALFGLLFDVAGKYAALTSVTQPDHVRSNQIEVTFVFLKSPYRLTVERVVEPSESDPRDQPIGDHAVTHYTPEVLDSDDDGTMPDNVDQLRQAVVGHRIVSAEKGAVPATRWGTALSGLVLTLDNGRRVCLSDTNDCCAYTDLKSFLLHPDKVDHVITGVGTTGSYEQWHIYADMGDVLELAVDWSCGNPFYYGYGFDITVVDAP